jgi:enoyl-CoA hydratase/carnithine racemase
MQSNDLRVERIGPVLRLTLNRPDAMNAMSLPMLQALASAVAAARDDDTVQVLLITGEGKAFCAGADLKAFEEGLKVGPGEKDFLEIAADAIRGVAEFPKPVIAAINGVALAGGLELAMSADILVAAESARLGDGHAKYGMYPGAGGAALLPRLLPRGVAMYLLFTGKLLSARDMHRLGFVAEVHADDALADAALSLGQAIAENSPVGLRRMKAVARAADDKSSEDALLHEQVMSREHIRSWDMAEGLAAFAQKRKPRFRGI